MYLFYCFTVFLLIIFGFYLYFLLFWFLSFILFLFLAFNIICCCPLTLVLAVSLSSDMWWFLFLCFLEILQFQFVIPLLPKEIFERVLKFPGSGTFLFCFLAWLIIHIFIALWLENTVLLLLYGIFWNFLAAFYIVSFHEHSTNIFRKRGASLFVWHLPPLPPKDMDPSECLYSSLWPGFPPLSV